MRRSSETFDPRQEMRRSDFELFHNLDTSLDAVGLHHHDFYEVYYFLSGTVEYRIEDKLYRLQTGDLLLVSPMELHQATVLDHSVPYERIVLWISQPYLDSLSVNGEALTQCFDSSRAEHVNLLRPADHSLLRDLLERLLEERAGNQYGSALYARGCLLQLLVLLNRMAMAAHTAPEAGSPLVSLIVRHINGHYAEPLSLDALAALAHVSKYYLSHEFSRVMGISVYRFIMLKRLQMAREMLLQGVSPGEAAVRCGFPDYPNFFRAFRARYNYGPSACAAPMAEDDIEPAAVN